MEKGTTDYERVIAFRRDTKALLRTRIREAIQMVLEEEFEEALGCGRYEREDARLGYWHGSVERRVTTPNGPESLEVPPGRLVGGDGRLLSSAAEFSSLRPPMPGGRRGHPGGLPGRR